MDPSGAMRLQPTAVGPRLRVDGASSLPRCRWSSWTGLNRRPLPYQGSALPLSYTSLHAPRTFSPAGWCPTDPLTGRPPQGGERGAGDRIRTGDIQLGKLTLYQLSYSRALRSTARPPNACGGQGWIRTSVGIRQRIYSPSPLTTRAPTHVIAARLRVDRTRPNLEPPIGIEPTTFRLQVGCSTS